ncbi:MAG: hypothetical protein ACTHN5_20865 [Phycisphaerae bacterium]
MSITRKSTLCPPSDPSNAVFENLRAVILLAGVVRNTPFNESIKRSILALPLDSDTTLLRHWYEQTCRLTASCHSRSLPLRVLVDPQSLLPVLPQLSDSTPLTIERDPLEFRGTGGVLFDSTTNYADHEYVLVATAATLLLNDLASLVTHLGGSNADIALLAEPRGNPTGIMLVRVGTLRQISPIGFVDLNEQALPAIAAKHTVRVVRHPVERYPIRSLSEYINAVRQFHLNRISGRTIDDPFSENWISTFSIAERPQAVVSSASLLDSVVLDGGEVRDEAVVVRSLICPGAVVRARETVIDEIVTA